MPVTRLTLDLQRESEWPNLPGERAFRAWARAALGPGAGNRELVIRLVDETESRALNGRYRGKDRPTNVLSFPFEGPPGMAAGFLGDLVICAPVVEREAAQQGKAPRAHWAHMVVHGVLHLMGYDHGNEAEAAEMEGQERTVLAELGFGDPYAIEQDS
jgi:probable rRNA maturation factor